MPRRLHFLYVCERGFGDLPGDDAQRRRCDECATVVHNLDAMPADERDELLDRAATERTTVCVSQTVARDEAGPCRVSAPPQEAVLLGMVAPASEPALPVTRPDPPPPTRGERGTTWRSFAADPAIVAAELTVLAPDFEVEPDGEHGWRHHHRELDLLVQIVSERDGTGTALGVRIASPERLRLSDLLPSSATNFLALAVLVVPLGVAVWIGLGMPLWLVPIAMVAAVLAIFVQIVGLKLLLVVFFELDMRPRRSRWIAAWHRRFWPALDARLAEHRPYR